MVQSRASNNEDSVPPTQYLKPPKETKNKALSKPHLTTSTIFGAARTGHNLEETRRDGARDSPKNYYRSPPPNY